MCDDIETTVADLRERGAQFRSAIEQREYGRIIMMTVPGADDIQLFSRLTTSHTIFRALVNRVIG